MNFYNLLSQRNRRLQTITRSFDYQSDLALIVFEQFKNEYIPFLIKQAIKGNKNEVDIIIGTNFADLPTKIGNQILTVDFGEEVELQYNMDIFSYLLLGQFISNIPGIVMLDFNMNYMDFKINLQQLIEYYYEELQHEDYMNKSR